MDLSEIEAEYAAFQDAEFARKDRLRAIDQALEAHRLRGNTADRDEVQALIKERRTL
jgi:hypothetical protein